MSIFETGYSQQKHFYLKCMANQENAIKELLI